MLWLSSASEAGRQNHKARSPGKPHAHGRRPPSANANGSNLKPCAELRGTDRCRVNCALDSRNPRADLPGPEAG